MGRGEDPPQRDQRQPRARLVPEREQIRAVRAGGGKALRRQLSRPGQSGADAAPGQLLVDLERAKLRRGPGTAGGQRLQDLGGAGDVPQPPQCCVAGVPVHGPRPRHARDRRARRPGAEREGVPVTPGRAARRFLADQAADVRPHPVLRRFRVQANCAAAPPDRSAAPPTVPAHGGSAPRIPLSSMPAASRITRIRRTSRRPRSAPGIRTSRRSPSCRTWSPSSTR